MVHRERAGPGSVLFRYSLGVAQFERFQFLIRTVPQQKGAPLWISFQVPKIKNGSGGSGSALGLWRIRVERTAQTSTFPSKHSCPRFLACPGVKKFPPITGAAGILGADVHDFQRGRPQPGGFSENYLQEEFALSVVLGKAVPALCSVSVPLCGSVSVPGLF